MAIMRAIIEHRRRRMPRMFNQGRFGRFVVIALALSVVTGVRLGAQGLPPDAIARFHINNANYMTDVGKYLEALEELQTAYDFSTGADIKAEAASLKGVLLASFFDNPNAAIAEY